MSTTPLPPPNSGITITSNNRTRDAATDPHRAAGVGDVRDLTEEELGIFIDTTECPDLSDDSDDDRERKGARGKKRGERKSRWEKDKNRRAPPEPAATSVEGKDWTPVTENIIDIKSSTQQQQAVPGRLQASSGTAGTCKVEGSAGITSSVETRSYGDKKTRERVFQQAVNLMSERCTTTNNTRQRGGGAGGPTAVRQGGTTAGKRTAKGGGWGQGGRTLMGHDHGSAALIQIHQRLPVPMSPLPAWRGYHGNVYFEPIKIHQTTLGNPPPAPDIPSPPAELNRLASQSVASGYFEEARTRNQSSRTQKSEGTMSTNRQMSLLDKRTVLFNKNEYLQEDLTWILGQEATGSLCARTTQTRSQSERSEQRNRSRSYESLKMKRPDTLSRSTSQASLRWTREHKTGGGDKARQRFPPLTIKGSHYVYSSKETGLDMVTAKPLHTNTSVGLMNAQQQQRPGLTIPSQQ